MEEQKTITQPQREEPEETEEEQPQKEKAEQFEAGEFCLLEDKGLGVFVEMHSTTLSADKLLGLCASGIQFLKGERLNSKTPLGIG